MFRHRRLSWYRAITSRVTFRYPCSACNDICNTREPLAVYHVLVCVLRLGMIPRLDTWSSKAEHRIVQILISSPPPFQNVSNIVIKMRISAFTYRAVMVKRWLNTVNETVLFQIRYYCNILPSKDKDNSSIDLSVSRSSLLVCAPDVEQNASAVRVFFSSLLRFIFSSFVSVCLLLFSFPCFLSFSIF